MLCFLFLAHFNFFVQQLIRGEKDLLQCVKEANKKCRKAEHGCMFSLAGDSDFSLRRFIHSLADILLSLLNRNLSESLDNNCELLAHAPKSFLV